MIGALMGGQMSLDSGNEVKQQSSCSESGNYLIISFVFFSINTKN